MKGIWASMQAVAICCSPLLMQGEIMVVPCLPSAKGDEGCRRDKPAYGPIGSYEEGGGRCSLVPRGCL